MEVCLDHKWMYRHLKIITMFSNKGLPLRSVVLGTQSCLALCGPQNVAHQVPVCPWYSPGKNTGMDWHSLLQRIFLD